MALGGPHTQSSHELKEHKLMLVLREHHFIIFNKHQLYSHLILYKKLVHAMAYEDLNCHRENLFPPDGHSTEPTEVGRANALDFFTRPEKKDVYCVLNI